jgi:hypothetical protein
MKTKDHRIDGILGEFDNPAELLKAAEKVRDAGYKRFDSHSPFPIHGMDAAMGIKASKLGWIVAGGGLLGGCTAIAMQWWTSAVDYKVIVSGKPLFSFQAFVPITFELTILFSAFCAVLGMFGLNCLPRLNHPVFNSDRFRKASDDGFFISIEACDRQFHADKAKEFLESIGSRNVEFLITDD